MLTGSELTTAITAILVGAVCVGFLLHWLWVDFVRMPRSDGARLGEMAERLHEADMAREEAEAARHEAEARLSQAQAELDEKLAMMQARLDGEIEGREAALAAELAEAKRELETMSDGLSHARRRILDLEAELEGLRGGDKP